MRITGGRQGFAKDVFGLCSLGGFMRSQRSQYPLIKEHTLNCRGLNNMVQGIP